MIGLVYAYKDEEKIKFKIEGTNIEDLFDIAKKICKKKKIDFKQLRDENNVYINSPPLPSSLFLLYPDRKDENRDLKNFLGMGNIESSNDII